MILFKVFSISLVCMAQTNMNAPQPSVQIKSQNSSRGVIDLGQLEVEGELRRPSVEWIDSQKRVRDWMPGLHQDEFMRLEAQLLKPLSRGQLRKELVKEAAVASH